MNELFEIYYVFLRIGMVAFGGGYALLPILVRELEEKRQWCTTDELMDYFAIGQCTPGVIALNVSTFIGNKRKGIPGAIFASVGFVTIPIIIILFIAAFLTNFADNPYVKDAFAGIRVCVCVLILQAVMRLWKKSIVDKKALCIYFIILFLTIFSGVLPISIPTAIIVVASGVFGVLFGKEGKDSTKEGK